MPLASRIRCPPPASVQPLVRAAPPLAAAAESRGAKTSRGSLQRRGGAFIFTLCVCHKLGGCRRGEA